MPGNDIGNMEEMRVWSILGITFKNFVLMVYISFLLILTKDVKELKKMWR